MTIAHAAKIAIQKIGGPCSVREIYDKIIGLGLYEFNTPDQNMCCGRRFDEKRMSWTDAILQKKLCSNFPEMIFTIL